jgi:hypothetical protein
LTISFPPSRRSTFLSCHRAAKPKIASLTCAGHIMTKFDEGQTANQKIHWSDTRTSREIAREGREICIVIHLTRRVAFYHEKSIGDIRDVIRRRDGGEKGQTWFVGHRHCSRAVQDQFLDARHDNHRFERILGFLRISTLWGFRPVEVNIHRTVRHLFKTLQLRHSALHQRATNAHGAV